jgi:hypothetical protein
MIRRMLILKDRTPVTQGRSRLVFEHPENPDWLVKVMRPDKLDERFGSGTPWYKRRRRFGPYLSYVREIQEFVAGWSSHGGSLPFLQKIIGLVETDLGLGLITGAVRGSDGKLAPSLANMLRAGEYDEQAEAALEKFIARLLDCDVIVSDLNPGNLVYAHSEADGHHFVMIDGIGNANIWPLKAMSRRFNRRSKLGRYRKLRGKIELRRRPTR